MSTASFHVGVPVAYCVVPTIVDHFEAPWCSSRSTTQLMSLADLFEKVYNVDVQRKAANVCVLV